MIRYGHGGWWARVVALLLLGAPALSFASRAQQPDRDSPPRSEALTGPGAQGDPETMGALQTDTKRPVEGPNRVAQPVGRPESKVKGTVQKVRNKIVYLQDENGQVRSFDASNLEFRHGVHAGQPVEVDSSNGSAAQAIWGDHGNLLAGKVR